MDNMKTFLIFITGFVLVCLLNAVAAFATPARVSNGKVEFAIAVIASTPSWSQAERTAAIAAGKTVVDLTPLDWEVNLSTCLVVDLGFLKVGFENFSDWSECQTRMGLKRKVMAVRALINSMSDLPASDSSDLNERARWLKSYYLSLP